MMNDQSLAQNSFVFQDAELVRTLLQALDPEQNPLFRSFVTRGLQKMITTLKAQYIDFLTENNLITSLIEKAKSVASQSTFGLLSIAQLQQLADGISKENMEKAKPDEHEEAKVGGGGPEIADPNNYNFMSTLANKLKVYSELQKVQSYFKSSGEQDDQSLICKNIAASVDDYLISLGAVRARKILITIMSVKPDVCQSFDKDQLF